VSRPARAAARHRPTTVATGAVVVSLGVRLRHRELRCPCASACITIFVVVVVEYQLVLVVRSLVIGDAGQDPPGADHVARAVKVLEREKSPKGLFLVGSTNC